MWLRGCSATKPLAIRDNRLPAISPNAFVSSSVALPQRVIPFLSQMLLGRFASGDEYEWLRIPARAVRAAFVWLTTTMTAALIDEHEVFDVVHLSNILDLLVTSAKRKRLASTRALAYSGAGRCSRKRLARRPAAPRRWSIACSGVVS